MALGGLDLGKQVGPLPLGAWIAVVGGGLAIGWYFSSGMGKDGGDATKVPLTEPGVGQGGGQFVYEPPNSVERPDNDPETNSQWGRQAVNWLISKGMDGTIAQSAVTKFLTGQNRTLQEAAMLNMVLLHFGAPPEDVPLPEKPDPVPTPKPPPKPTPKPPTPIPWRYHITQRGESQYTIARKYGISQWALYWANDKVNLRPDGTRGVLVTPLATPIGVALLIPSKQLAGAHPPPPKQPPQLPIRYHTVRAGETLTTIGKKYGTHVWNIFTANDVAGRRPDGSAGFLRSFTIKPGQRLIIPYD